MKVFFPSRRSFKIFLSAPFNCMTLHEEERAHKFYQEKTSHTHSHVPNAGLGLKQNKKAILSCISKS